MAVWSTSVVRRSKKLPQQRHRSKTVGGPDVNQARGQSKVVVSTTGRRVMLGIVMVVQSITVVQLSKRPQRPLRPFRTVGGRAASRTTGPSEVATSTTGRKKIRQHARVGSSINVVRVQSRRRKISPKVAVGGLDVSWTNGKFAVVRRTRYKSGPKPVLTAICFSAA